jgi:hypothetical protein
MNDQDFSAANQNPYILKKYGYDIAVTYAKTSFNADNINFDFSSPPASFDPPLLVQGKITNIGNVGNVGNLSDYQGKLFYHYVSNNQTQGQQPTYRATEFGAYWNYNGYGNVTISQGTTGQFVSYDQDFTFEYFQKKGSSDIGSQVQFGFGYPTYGNKNWNIMATDGGLMRFVWTTGESFASYNLDLTTSNDVFNNFSHIAITRKNGVLKSFLNGQLVDTDSTPQAAANFDETGAAFTIGGGNGGSNSNALFSNIRYVVGSALYDSDFAVPSIPLQIVNGSGTRLLVTGFGGSDSSLWAGTSFEFGPAASGNAAIVIVDTPYT